jgi:hypothetical protein
MVGDADDAGRRPTTYTPIIPERSNSHDAANNKRECEKIAFHCFRLFGVGFGVACD